MADDTERQLKKIVKMIESLANEVHEIKHSVVALTQSIGIADTANDLIEQAQAQDRKDAFEEKRHRSIVSTLAHGYSGARGDQCVAWFRERLSQHEYGPLREPEDIVRYNLDGQHPKK